MGTVAPTSSGSHRLYVGLVPRELWSPGTVCPSDYGPSWCPPKGLLWTAASLGPPGPSPKPLQSRSCPETTCRGAGAALGLRVCEKPAGACSGDGIKAELRLDKAVPQRCPVVMAVLARYF